MPTARNIIHLVPKNLQVVGRMLAPRATQRASAPNHRGHSSGSQLLRLAEGERPRAPGIEGDLELESQRYGLAVSLK